jgi:predicted RNase H-related nuclease YkuK (DUF458 family)
MNRNKPWFDADGCEVNKNKVNNEIINYATNGGKVFIGADSMYYTGKCRFAAVIALHDNNQNIAKYYYQKLNQNSNLYKDIKVKILEEVNLAIQSAEFVLSIYPDANIELHVDISKHKSAYSSKLYKTVKNWVKSLGYDFKIKPESWASSSIADWHTK